MGTCKSSMCLVVPDIQRLQKVLYCVVNCTCFGELNDDDDGDDDDDDYDNQLTRIVDHIICALR